MVFCIFVRWLKCQRCLGILGEQAGMTSLAVVLFTLHVSGVVKGDAAVLCRQNGFAGGALLCDTSAVAPIIETSKSSANDLLI